MKIKVVIRFLPVIFASAMVLRPAWGEEFRSAFSDDDHGLNSLIQLLEQKAMLEMENPARSREGRSHRGVARPTPELGGREGKPLAPLDLSRYLGTEGDQDEAIRRLKSAGKWPADTGPGGEKLEPDLFKNIPTDKRLDYAAECLESGGYDKALAETTYILATEPEEEHLARALSLRLRAFYRLRKFEQAQEAYFRLRAYFPGKPDAVAALEFLEKESGIDRLQEAVRQNQEDSEAQQKLVRAYRDRRWLELAVEFYDQRLSDRTAQSYRESCGLHYLLKDWIGLIESSKRGIELRPNAPEFYYNLGVGYYHLNDNDAKCSARESFMKAKQLSTSAEFNKRVDWYLRRLPRTG